MSIHSERGLMGEIIHTDVTGHTLGVSYGTEGDLHHYDANGMYVGSSFDNVHYDSSNNYVGSSQEGFLGEIKHFDPDLTFVGETWGDDTFLI